MPNPAIVVKTTMRGLNGVTKKLEPQVLFEIVRQSMTDTLVEMVGLVKDYTPKDTGTAAESTYYSIEGETVRGLEGKVSNPESYFATLNYGRRVGAPMPPPEPIMDWAESHGIDLSAVFPIQRAISTRGLPAYHMMERALAQGRKKFKGVFLKRYIDQWNNS